MNTGNFSVDALLTGALTGLQTSTDIDIEKVATLLDQFGLRWNVEKQPLILPTGEETGFFGIVREDTKKTFATCKDGYTPFQNSELAELLIRIADKTGYDIHSGGNFNGGGKVYLQLDTGNEIKNIGRNRDNVKGYVTGINSHDGSTSLKWGAVNFTVYCRNTFAAAVRNLQHSARHTASIHDKVETSLRQIEGIAKQEETIFSTFIKLSEIEAKSENIAQIVKRITKVEIDANGRPLQSDEKIGTYAKNRTNELLNSITTEMNSKGRTLWGLFSGVTHYTSHVLPTPDRLNARLESKYTGTGLELDNAAFNMILEAAHI